MAITLEQAKGIIPACAGSTTHPTRPKSADRDHPRMRGEHGRSAGRGYVPSGSSPHARGALTMAITLEQAKGIIPACAGSTQRPRNRLHSKRDHPRMRGEHAVSMNPLKISSGSSPHARGALLESVALVLKGGDHPRMRGEHVIEGCTGIRYPGSSPHARGALDLRPFRKPSIRIIPACAGSTLHDQRVWSTFSLNTFTFCKL